MFTPTNAAAICNASFSEGKPEKVHLQLKFFFDWAGLNVEDLMFDVSFNASN